MGWERYWLVRVEFGEQHSPPVRRDRRERLVLRVAQLREALERARSDPTVIAVRYELLWRLDRTDEPASCSNCQQPLRGPIHIRAKPGWMRCQSSPGHLTYACNCETTTVFPVPSFDCAPVPSPHRYHTTE